MKKYRIKTEGEFIAEFGDNWRNLVRFTWTDDSQMDYLFDQPLEKIITPQSLRLVENQVDFIALKAIKGWSISKEMITDLKKFPNTELINTVR